MTTTPIIPDVGAALSARARPPRPSALSASRTFAWRALLKLRHVPEQLIDVIGIPVIFTLGFTYLFGGALAGSPRAYLHFLLPGTLAMTVVLVTTFSGVTLNTGITTGVYDRSGRCRSGGRRRSSAPCSATAAATCSPRRSSSPSAWCSATGPAGAWSG